MTINVITWIKNCATHNHRKILDVFPQQTLIAAGMAPNGFSFDPVKMMAEHDDACEPSMDYITIPQSSKLGPDTSFPHWYVCPSVLDGFSTKRFKFIPFHSGHMCRQQQGFSQPLLRGLPQLFQGCKCFHSTENPSNFISSYWIFFTSHFTGCGQRTRL